jgi:hypothetical protein
VGSILHTSRALIRPSAGLFAASIYVIAAHPAAAGQSSATRPEICAPPLPTPPRIDGVLDDAAWREAAAIGGFVQQSPRDGAPATEQTDVWIGYDSARLYVAVHARYADPSMMRANLGDRDNTDDDDMIAIYLDPFMDQQRGYKFSVNGYGVQGDAIVSSQGGQPWEDGSEDESWDALFDSRGRIVEDGWTAEIALPFKSFRYPAPPGADHRWGFQLQRTIEAKDEEDVWAPVSRDIQGFLSQMGVLCGLRNLSTSRNLELLPTLAAVRFESRERDGVLSSQRGVDPSAGLNVKYGLSSNLTLDFALNPDFSQIEADEPQITLNQRFPIFYDEKRPFFLEGSEIFNTQTNLVHTRTIVDPFIGAKLTGKIGRTTIGVMATNDEAPGLRDDPLDPASGRVAKAVIGRVRYDFYSESFLGVIVTDREFLRSASRVAGIDGRFRLGDTRRFSFMISKSGYRDEEGAAKDGEAFDVEFRQNGRSLRYGISHTSRSPDFETDLGFIRRTDMIETQGDVSYQFWPQSAVISWGPGVEYLRNYDYAGVLHDESANLDVNIDFARNISVRADIDRTMERFEGGDFFMTTGSVQGELDFSRNFSVEAEGQWGDGLYYGDAPFVGRSFEGSVELGLRPSPRLETSISLDISQLTDPRTELSVVDQHIYRARTTYQFSDRLFLRNILEYDTGLDRFGSNLLLTYRINAGTVVFAGYDDQFERFTADDGRTIPVNRLQRASRSVFLKISYLFRM